MFLTSCVNTFLAMYENYVNEEFQSKELYNIQENRIFIRGIEVITMHMLSIGGLSNFSLQFPQLNDFSDDTIVKINRLIYDMIVTYGNINGQPYNIFEFKNYWQNVKINYRVVYYDDKFLSIHFYGDITGGSVGVRGFMEVQKAITIDLNTGEVLSLGDFFTYDEMKDIIMSISLYENYSTLQNINYAIKHFNDLLSTNTLLQDYRNFYIKENGIALIGIPMPSSTKISIFEIELESSPVRVLR